MAGEGEGGLGGVTDSSAGGESATAPDMGGSDYGHSATMPQELSSFFSDDLPSFDTPTETETPTEEPSEEGEEGEGKPAGEEGEEEPKAEEESDAPAVKKVSFKVGDEEVEIPEDAVVMCTVDGKEEPVSIADLRKDYAGRVAYERKFQDLANDKKKFAADVALVDRRINRVFKELHSDTPERGLELLFEMGGKGARERAEAVMKKFSDHFEKLAGMTEAERTLYEKEQKLAMKEESLKEQETARDTQIAETKLAEKTTQVLNENGLSVEEFGAAWQKLLAAAQAGHWNAKGLTKEQLVEATVDQALIDRHYAKIDNGLRTVDPELLKDAKLRDDLARMITPDFKHEDIVEVVQALVGRSSSPSSEATPSKDLSKTATSAKSSEAPKKEAEDKKESPEEDEEFMKGVLADLRSSLY